MTAIGWRKRGGSKPLKFTKEKHMSTEAEKQEPACPHIDEPLGCYRVRCQLGRKCVDAQSQPKREWVGLTDEDLLEARQKAMLYYGYDQKYSELMSSMWFYVLIKTIETKLREKNNGNSAV